VITDNPKKKAANKNSRGKRPFANRSKNRPDKRSKNKSENKSDNKSENRPNNRPNNRPKKQDTSESKPQGKAKKGKVLTERPKKQRRNSRNKKKST